MPGKSAAHNYQDMCNNQFITGTQHRAERQKGTEDEKSTGEESADVMDFKIC